MSSSYSGRPYTASGTDRSPPSRVQVEVILISAGAYLFIRSDEKSPIQRLHRSGVRIVKRDGPVAILDMTESRAIANNLV